MKGVRSPCETRKKILELLNARSEQALQELNRSYSGLCRKIAENILSSAEDVEETVSDAFLAVWDSVPPEQPLSLSAYLGRVTRNLSLARLRSNTAAMRDDRLTVCLSELELCLPSPETPESRLEGAVITDTINRYLTSLSKTNRIIFIRRYYCMDSTREISQMTGLTDQAIRSRLLRMRGELRERLEKEGIFV